MCAGERGGGGGTVAHAAGWPSAAASGSRVACKPTLRVRLRGGPHGLNPPRGMAERRLRWASTLPSACAGRAGAVAAAMPPARGIWCGAAGATLWACCKHTAERVVDACRSSTPRMSKGRRSSQRAIAGMRDEAPAAKLVPRRVSLCLISLWHAHTSHLAPVTPVEAARADSLAGKMGSARGRRHCRPCDCASLRTASGAHSPGHSTGPQRASGHTLRCKYGTTCGKLS